MRLARLAALVTLAPLVACGPDDTSGACKDNLLAGDLVLTEVFADFAAPSGGTGTDDGKEWFELYNNADRPVSLRGVTVVHSRPDGSKSATHTLDDVTVAPGQYFTLGNATSDLVPPYVDYGFGADLGDFFNTDGGKLALKCGTAVIDEAVYDAVRSGHSRQLSASGPPDYTANDDQVNWCEANDSEFEPSNFGTPGQDNDCSPIIMGVCNEGGSMRPLVSPQPGELVITEVMPGPNGTDSDAEWIELKALASFDLNGVGVGRISDTTPEILGAQDCIPVTSGTNIVLAHTLDMGLNGGLPAASTLATFETSLVPGSTTTPGDIQITAGMTPLDAISWTRSTTAKSLQLDPDFTTATANDDFANFCDGSATYGAGGMGSPGVANGQCASQPPAGMCDPGTGVFRNIVKPPAGALVISEFLANPALTGTDATQEWFEVTNVSGAPFDLNGLGLQGNSTTVNLISSNDCKQVMPNGFAVFAHSLTSATNGGITVVDATFTFAINQGSTGTPGRLQVLDGTTPLDTITWTASADGVASQVKPGVTLTTTGNDMFPANYCPATAAQKYGTPNNYGTPRAANVCL